jgi:hypothetical protein
MAADELCIHEERTVGVYGILFLSACIRQYRFDGGFTVTALDLKKKRVEFHRFPN